MDKIKPALISKIKKYLKDINVPFMRLHNDNILLLRSAGSHHYLMIQFYSMPEGWFTSMRHFDIKIARPDDYEKAMKSIDKYLKQQ